jgi:hypothetical protein
MRPHPTHSPKANGVRVLPHLDAGWVLVVVGLVVVTLAIGGATL